ncbi:hypothetical protein AN1V17_39620 [Vallitalea sediminicola]
MDSIESRIIEIISVIFDEYEGIISPYLNKDDIKQWDSLALAQIIMILESEFDKHLSDEEIMSISSVADIIELVKENR